MSGSGRFQLGDVWVWQVSGGIFFKSTALRGDETGMSNAVLRPRHKPVTHLPISRFSLVRRQLTVRAAGIRVFGIGKDPLFEWQEGIERNGKGLGPISTRWILGS